MASVKPRQKRLKKRGRYGVIEYMNRALIEVQFSVGEVSSVTATKPPIELAGPVNELVKSRPESSLSIDDRLKLLASASTRSMLEVEDSIRRDLATLPGPWTQTVGIREVWANGRGLLLTGSIRGTMKQEAEGYSLDVPELGIYVIGHDVGSIRREFDGEFADLIEEYANVPEDQLDGPARKLRARLLSLLGRQ